MRQNPNLAVLEITVQRLAPDEWQAYRAIRLEALKSESQAFGASYAKSLELTDDHWRQGLESALDGPISKLLFAKDADRKVVGMIGSGLSEDGTTAHVYAMFVTSLARGLGVASRLLGTLMDEMRGCAEIGSISLTVNKSQTAAIALYTKFGFQRVKITREAMGDGCEYDAWVMAWTRDPFVLPSDKL